MLGRVWRMSNGPRHGGLSCDISNGCAERGLGKEP